ncbi:MAG: glycosyltransferase family 2 protein [Acidobacteria bacterium]|nr:glycosyltransferase family 2 protein [Acidobacteriota bacterium]
MNISVIITSYNQKHYLAEAVYSVLAQTRPCFEIILVDDASSDGSPKLVAEYAARYPDQIRAFCHQENLGIPGNRNFALSRVRGEYVAVLDGDDRFLPSKNEREMEFIRQNPDCLAVYSNVRYIDKSGRVLRNRDHRPQPAGMILGDVFRGMFGMLRSMLIRYDMLQEIGFMDPDFWHYDGFDLMVRLSARYPVHYILEPLAEVRLHTAGASGWRSIRHEIDDLTGVYQKHQHLMETLSRREAAKVERYWQVRIGRMSATMHWRNGQRWQGIRRFCGALARSPALMGKLTLGYILPKSFFLRLVTWYHLIRKRPL